MVTAGSLVDKYISFFEKRGHKRIENASLVPENDPTTLFTSSGMQPLVPYLLGEDHPLGQRLVNVQNCFRAQDIDEVGDNRHTTFFRMLGNWSLSDYFKKEQLPWFFEFLTGELGLDPKRLYVSVFNGFGNIPKDNESAKIWEDLFTQAGVDPKGRIFFFGTEENWWSRAGVPEDMPEGEPGGPDSEVFFDFYPKEEEITNSNLKVYSHNGRLLEIGNSVFMQYIKQKDPTFKELPQKNVDFGGGLERLLAAVQGKQDIFQTNLFTPITGSIEKVVGKNYKDYKKETRIIADHLIASAFIIANNVTPGNKEQGYLLRRLLRRSFDNLLGGNIEPIISTIVENYKETDPYLIEKFENVKNTILDEEQKYTHAKKEAKKYIAKKYTQIGDELKGEKKISEEDAFILYTTHGLSPTQIKSLGFNFDHEKFAQKMKEHQKVSRAGASKKFAAPLQNKSKVLR